MASGGSSERDSVFYKKVINKCWTRFVEDLDPVALLDVFLEKEYFTATQARDIRELTNTSERNREILAKVNTKGVKGYIDFKKFLIKSHQEHLAECLDEIEAKVEEEIPAVQETTANIYNRTGFKCSVCDLSFDTVQLLVQHTQTPEHINVIKEQQNFAKENQKDIEEDQTGDDLTSLSSTISDMNEHNTTDSSDQVSQCYLCDVKYTSPSHANSHISGKHHKKKKALFDMKFHKENPSFAGNESIRQPTENADQVKSQISLPLDTLSLNNTTMTVDPSKTNLACDICNVPFTSQFNAQQHYDSEKHKKKIILLQKQELGEILPTACDICNCSFSGQENAAAHFNGEKHRKALKKANVEGGDSLPLFCKICACPFSSELNAKQHFESKKHKRKLELNEMNAEDSNRNKSLGCEIGGQVVSTGENDVHSQSKNGGATAQRIEDEVEADFQSLSLCDN